MSYLFSSSPWKIVKDPDGSVNIVSGIQTVANVYATNEEFYSEFTQEANANLIANAPEMYALLETVDIISEYIPERMPEVRDRIEKLFLKMGVTLTQYKLKQYELIKQEVRLNLAQKELEAEMKAEEEATILQKYFGDRWEEFEIHSADVGYHIVSKGCDEGNESSRFYYDEEYFLLGTNDKEGVKPCYFDYSSWDIHSDEIAYVFQDEDLDKVLVSLDDACAYQCGEILDEFIKAGIEEPDMDKITKLLKGQSIEELIQDYRKEKGNEN